MLEKTLARNVMKWFATQPDCWAVKIVGSPYGRRGVPDILACVRGCFLGVELKVGDGKPTASQEHELRAIGRAEGYALVATSLDQVKAAVELLRTRDRRLCPSPTASP